MLSTKDYQAARLKGSLLEFIQVFFKLVSGKEFVIDNPLGREPHVITLCRTFTSVLRGDLQHVIVSIPPRYGKSLVCQYFVCWALAQFPDSEFIYISYSKELATEQTEKIRDIMLSPHYKYLFGVTLRQDAKRKDKFSTNYNGHVYAAGAQGSVTGFGAGRSYSDKFGGALIIDDIHKPEETHSDTYRTKVKDWFQNTLSSRVNNPTHTPIINVGQRLHEDDLAANLLTGLDQHTWTFMGLPSLDSSQNALSPLKHTTDELLEMQKAMPYMFAAQMQQDPIPAGGGLFKKDWFPILRDDPEILYTFITADTAETDKTYNDATVFSFWGVYNKEYKGIDLGKRALHWLDCVELWVEPKDLEQEFLAFLARCMRYKIKPDVAAIEKKSTGVTLISVLKQAIGLHVLEIERSRASGSKIQRFLDIQPYISTGRVSVTQNTSHLNTVLSHMAKITANNAHRYDDIADTCADAVRIALIDKTLYSRHNREYRSPKVALELSKANSRRVKARLEANIWPSIVKKS